MPSPTRPVIPMIDLGDRVIAAAEVIYAGHEFRSSLGGDHYVLRLLDGSGRFAYVGGSMAFFDLLPAGPWLGPIREDHDVFVVAEFFPVRPGDLRISRRRVMSWTDLEMDARGGWVIKTRTARSATQLIEWIEDHGLQASTRPENDGGLWSPLIVPDGCPPSLCTP